MSLRIQKKGIVQYILLYMLMIFNGAVIYRNNQDILLIIMFAIAVIIIFPKIKLKETEEYLFHILMLVIAALVTCFLTDGSLSVGSIFNIVVRFLFVYAVMVYDSSKFTIRFVKIIIFLSVISLVMFFLQSINSSIITTFSISMEYGTGVFYVTPFYTMSNWAINRNVGIMTEPGLYQILLNAALYCLMFIIKDDEFKHRFNAIIIICITIITSQSTTGYISMLILLICFYSKNMSKLDKKIRKRITKCMVVAGAVIILIFVFGGSISFIQTTVIDKLFGNGSTTLNLTESTGNARIVSMQTDWILFMRYPLGCGYDIYSSLWKSLLVSHIGDTASCCGITYCLAVFGILFNIVLWRFYIVYAKKNSNSKSQFIALMLLLINTGVGQPLMYYPIFIAIFIMRGEKKKNEYHKENNYGYL